MKNSPLTSLLAAATLFLAPAILSAQPAPDDNDEAPAPPRAPRWERFDTNKDGKLDDTERAAAEAAMRAKLTQEPRFIERADTDGDGKISDAEWAAAKEKFQQMRKRFAERGERAEQRGDRGERGPRGPREGMRDPEFRRGYLLGKFDANGDHKLDDTERAALRADMEKHIREHLEKQLARLKAADTNGDGKFSDEEWAAAKKTFREEFRKEHPGMPGRDMPPPPPEE